MKGMVLIVTLIIMCFGCTPVMLGSVGLSAGQLALMGEQGTFQDSASIDFMEPKPEALKLIMEAGKELGYDVQKPGHNMVMLAKGTSTGSLMVSAATMGLAQRPVIIINATLTQDRMRLDLSVIISGKTSSANEEESARILVELKERVTGIRISKVGK